MFNFIIGAIIGSVVSVGILILLQSGKNYENSLENK